MEVTTKERKYSLGGSDAGGLLWLNPYSSPFDVWQSKALGRESEFTENKWTYWGQAKEQTIAEHYAYRHNVKLIESPKRLSKWEWFTGTPDRLIVAPDDVEKRADLRRLGTYSDPVSGQVLVRRGLEIKTGLAKHRVKWAPEGCVGIGMDLAPVIRDFKSAEGKVPLYYWYQTQHYMHLMEFSEWDLCVLLDSSDYREYRIKYDAEFMAKAFETCRVFWEQHVQTKKPPAYDWGDSVKRYLGELYPEHSDEIIKIGTEESEEKARELRAASYKLRDLLQRDKALRGELQLLEQEQADLKAEIDRTKKVHDSLASWFRFKIGSKEGAETKEGVITWKADKNGQRSLRKKWY